MYDNIICNIILLVKIGPKHVSYDKLVNEDLDKLTLMCKEIRILVSPNFIKCAFNNDKVLNLKDRTCILKLIEN